MTLVIAIETAIIVAENIALGAVAWRLRSVFKGLKATGALPGIMLNDMFTAFPVPSDDKESS